MIQGVVWLTANAPGEHDERMRILVHDYSGHPFQVHLARALAHRGHEVLYVHCTSYPTGKGAVSRLSQDPDTFRVEPIDLGTTFDRYSVGRRVRQELAYGSSFAALAAASGPEVILSSNDPLLAKARAARWCRLTGTPWVFWLQDVYSMAMAGYAQARLGIPGRAIGHYLQALERRLLREAAAVVAITDDFRPVLHRWGVPADRCHVIENWAPIEELPTAPKDNPWSREYGLHNCRVLLYSGTLGLKHNPGLLAALAERFRGDDDVRVVVLTEGMGAQWLAREGQNRKLDNLVLLPYQPYERLPEVLASGDVLLALLERDAGVFSVPSKILSYLCAGRPILAAIPKSNLAARTIERAGAGSVVSSDDSEGFIRAAARLVGDGDLRHRYGGQARAYAERAFDIGSITSRFERILAAAAQTRLSI